MATLHQNSQPDQLNTHEAPLKSSVVISTTVPEDLNKTQSSEQIAQGLLNLHSKLDRVLSKSRISSHPLNIETSVNYGNSYIEERQVLSSRLYETPRMTAPVVYETANSQAYNPFGFASVHNVVPNHYASPVHHANPMYWSQPQTAVYQSSPHPLSLSTVQLPHSAGYQVQQPVYYHQGPVQMVHPGISYVLPTSASYVQRDRPYYTGELTNDNDSVISDYRDREEEDLSEDEDDPRVKKVGGAQNVPARKISKTINDPDFVKKGPYSQQKRQNITAKDAKKHFDKPSQIPNFNFGNRNI